MLRPLGVGEILDAGIKVVTHNWKPLILSLLVVTAPIEILAVLTLASIGDSDTPTFNFSTTQSQQTTPDADYFIGIGIVGLLSGIGILLAYTALFKGVSDAWLGARPSIGRSLSFGLRRAPLVFVLWLVWIFPMIVFAIPCGIGSLWLGTVWSLAIPALLFERLGPIKALGRSFRLISGRFWATLLLIIIVLALIEVISIAIQYPLLLLVDAVGDSNDIANAVATVVASLVSTSITYPYMVAVLTILYFDQRVRKEGFDLQLLAQGLGVERDPDAPVLIPPPPMWGPHSAGGQPQGPPSPHWQPGGWTPPAASNGGPMHWGPATPTDDRPPEESPWMTPGPPPADDPPPSGGSLWGEQPDEEDDERPRGPGGL